MPQPPRRDLMRDRKKQNLRLLGALQIRKLRLRVLVATLIALIIVAFFFIAQEYNAVLPVTLPTLSQHKGQLDDQSASQDSATEGATREDLIYAVQKMVDVPCDLRELTNYGREIGPDVDSLRGDGESRATSEKLKEYLKLSDKDVQKLHDLHEKVVKIIPSKLKEGEFKGRGIVMSADGIYFPSALATIRFIRARGYQTPVELFIGRRSAWESSCDELLPSINVTCKCLEDFYGDYFNALSGLGGYLHKPLSVLMSDFDEIYWTDPDSLPLVDVEEYLKEPLFQQIGYIFTSDYWPRLTSPYFYDITNLTLGPDEFGSSKKMRQIDRENAISGMSTESGQFYVKKSLHFRSLVLSLYYNVKGRIWWPLLTQGAPGEGDKEVWPAAAQVLGEPWYQTHTNPLEAGYRENGGMHGFCMVQPDFLRDFEMYTHGRDNLPKTYMAAHFNILKLNVQRTLGENGGSIPKGRFLGSLSAFQKATNLDGDVELEIWTAARDSACEWAVEKHLIPNNWGSIISATRYCEALRRRVEFLVENPEVSTPLGVKP